MALSNEDRRPRLGPGDRVIDEAFAVEALPRREFGAHKWGVGGLVIVAGAPGYAGAAVLSAMAAGRAGAGIMNVACSRSVAGIVVGAVPEAATIPLPESEAVAGSKSTVAMIEAKLQKSAALLVGPGLGEDELADALMRTLFGSVRARQTIGFGIASPGLPDAERRQADGGLVGRSGKPVVIDADGLNWLAKQENWQERIPERRALLTPHVGELARLLGAEAAELMADPVATVREAAGRWKQTVVFKYGYTAVSDGERTLVAGDAPVSLATAGAGDVLAGTIGGLLAQGLSPLNAAALAIYLGSRAARRVERRVGTFGLVASDLPLAIAEELARLEQRREADGDGR